MGSVGRNSYTTTHTHTHVQGRQFKAERLIIASIRCFLFSCTRCRLPARKGNPSSNINSSLLSPWRFQAQSVSIPPPTNRPATIVQAPHNTACPILVVARLRTISITLIPQPLMFRSWSWASSSTSTGRQQGPSQRGIFKQRRGEKAEGNEEDVEGFSPPFSPPSIRRPKPRFCGEGKG